MLPGVETIERIDLVLKRVIEITCVALMVAIIATILASVTARFVIFYPLNFADALAKYLMQWVAFLGVGLAIRTGEHVLVDMVTSTLDNRWRLNLYVFTNLLMIGLFAAIVWHGTTYAMSGLRSRDIFVFNISMAIPYFSVPVGAAYALLATSFATWIAIARSRAPSTQIETEV